MVNNPALETQQSSSLVCIRTHPRVLQLMDRFRIDCLAPGIAYPGKRLPISCDYIDIKSLGDLVSQDGAACSGSFVYTDLYFDGNNYTVVFESQRTCGNDYNSRFYAKQCNCLTEAIEAIASFYSPEQNASGELLSRIFKEFRANGILCSYREIGEHVITAFTIMVPPDSDVVSNAMAIIEDAVEVSIQQTNRNRCLLRKDSDDESEGEGDTV